MFFYLLALYLVAAVVAVAAAMIIANMPEPDVDPPIGWTGELAPSLHEMSDTFWVERLGRTVHEAVEPFFVEMLRDFPGLLGDRPVMTAAA